MLCLAQDGPSLEGYFRAITEATSTLREGGSLVSFFGGSLAFVFFAGSEATVSNGRPPGRLTHQPPAAWEQTCEKDPLTPYTHIHVIAYTLNIHKCKGN